LLNYVWLSLIVFGVASALFIDLSDISSNRYHNSEPIPVTLDLNTQIIENTVAVYEGTIKIKYEDYNYIYGSQLSEDLYLPASLSFSGEKNKSSIVKQ